MGAESVRKRLMHQRLKMRTELEADNDDVIELGSETGDNSSSSILTFDEELKAALQTATRKSTRKKTKARRTKLQSEIKPAVVIRPPMMMTKSKLAKEQDVKKSRRITMQSTLGLKGPTKTTVAAGNNNSETHRHHSSSRKLAQENEALKTTNAKLMTELNENLGQKYQDHLEMYSKSVNDLNQKYQESKDETLRYQTEISQLRTSLHRATVEVETCNDRYEKLVEQYRVETSSLHNALDTSKAQHIESTQAIRSQMKQMKDLEHDFQELLSDKTALENNVASQLKAQQTAYHERITELKTYVATLTQKLESQSNDIASTTEEFKKQNLAGLEIQNSLRDKLNLTLRSKETLSMENKELYQHVHSLQKDVESYQHRLKNLERKSTTELREMEESLRTLRQRNSQLEADLGASKKSRERAETAGMSRKAALDNAKSQVEVLETELARLKLGRTQDKDELETKDTALSHANVTVHQLQKTILNLERRVERFQVEAEESEKRLHRYRKDHMMSLRDSSVLSLPLQYPPPPLVEKMGEERSGTTTTKSIIRD